MNGAAEFFIGENRVAAHALTGDRKQPGQVRYPLFHISVATLKLVSYSAPFALNYRQDEIKTSGKKL